MPRTISKTLSFPLGGVVRRDTYRQQTRPYSAPWAVNVRGVDVLESRNRGGSRPGLVEVEDVTEATTDVWEWPNGETIEFPDESDIEFTYAETQITGPGGVRVVDPTDLISVVADTGAIPDDYTISCIYRDRVFISKNAVWYASRMGNHRDWDYGVDMSDSGRAVAGTVELAGRTVDQSITALIPYRDKALIIATCNSLHILEGDPTTGTLRIIDESIGIIAPYAWAFSGEILAFLSNDGVYIGGIGQKPVRFSEGRMPAELKNVATTNTITMAHDPGARGFHLFITPASGTGKHYFLDMDNKAIWPVVFGAAGHQPVVAARIKSSNLERVLLKGRDGTWREFVNSATDDDGTALQSHVLIGPVRVAANDSSDGMLAEMHGLLANITGSVTWRIVMGDMAETVADAAVVDLNRVLAGNTPLSVSATGTWSGGRNYVVHPRTRGAWAVIWLSASTKWAMEAVDIIARQLGRIR